MSISFNNERETGRTDGRVIWPMNVYAIFKKADIPNKSREVTLRHVGSRMRRTCDVCRSRNREGSNNRGLPRETKWF